MAASRDRLSPKRFTLIPVSLLIGLVALSGCSGNVDVKQSNDLLQAPQMNEAYLKENFEFPSAQPSLVKGKELFQQNCAACHAPSFWQEAKVQTDLTYSTPIDYYLMLTTGKAPEVAYPSEERKQIQPGVHQNPQSGELLAFREKLTPDERWAVIFYTRYLAGMSDLTFHNQNGKALTVQDDIFGGNCAVCHGKTGHAEGFLHTGKPSKPHGVEGGKVVGGLFQPAPASFHDYKRMYNRTDAQLHRYISQGIYPTAMPRWYGRVDKDKSYIFNDDTIWKLVRYVRQYAYKADLPDTMTAPKGLNINTKNESWYRAQSGTDYGFTGDPGTLIPANVSGAASAEPAVTVVEEKAPESQKSSKRSSSHVETTKPVKPNTSESHQEGDHS
jgi:mono/diheme cytochrome c family protein